MGIILGTYVHGTCPQGRQHNPWTRLICSSFWDSRRQWADAALTAVLQKLAEDKVALQRRRDILKRTVQDLGSQYEALKTQLSENETYVQVEIDATILRRPLFVYRRT